MKFQTLAAVSLATIGSQIGFAASVAHADFLPNDYFNKAFIGPNGSSTTSPTPGLSVAPYPPLPDSASTQNKYSIPYLSATTTAPELLWGRRIGPNLLHADFGSGSSIQHPCSH